MTSPLLHERTEKQLREYLARPSHALLVTGASGLGKSLILEWVTSELLGKKIDTRNNAAIRYIEPDARQTIPIEVIQNLRQFTKIQTTGKGIDRVIIIRDAECMSHEAETALLKLLEEPPAGVVILLSAMSPTLLLETIRSRVTQIEIIPPRKAVLAEYFDLKLESPEFQKAYSISQGAVGIMQRILRDGGVYQPLETAKSFVGLSMYEKLTRVDMLSKDRGDTLHFLEALLTLYRILCHARAAKSDREGVRTFHQKVEAVQATIESIASNGSMKLQLDALILHL